MTTFAILTNFEESGATIYIFFCCRTPTWTQSANLPLVLRPRPPRRPRHPASSEAVAHSPPPRQTPPLPLRPRPPHLPRPWSTTCSRRKTWTTKRIFPGTVSWQKFYLRTLSLTHTLLQLQPGGPPGPCTKRGEQPQGGQPHVLALPGPHLRRR